MAVLCGLKEWEDQLSGPSYIPENKNNVRSTPEGQPPTSPWVSKRPRNPSPSAPDCSPFRPSRTQSLQTLEAHSPEDKTGIIPSTSLSEEELWKEADEDKREPGISPPQLARRQKIMEALNEDEGPPRKRKRVDFSPVDIEQPMVTTPKPMEHHRSTTLDEADDPFLAPSSTNGQVFTIHGENVTATPDSVTDHPSSQELIQALEDTRKGYEDAMAKLASRLNKQDRRLQADSKSLEDQKKRIDELELELEEQQSINAALQAENNSLKARSLSTSDSQATIIRLRNINAALKAENQSLKEIGSIKLGHSRGHSQSQP
ncbi:hypothetical protein CPB86DRAFT_838277 [Serendipita vermifera]|nr:hypothetical protein CPB86DRAFT_838277 [Serendipita vermifera]